MTRLIFSLVSLLSLGYVASAQEGESSTFNRKAYYNAMSSAQLPVVEAQLSALQKANVSHKQAFEGALIMKKAGLAGNPAKKLSLFKSGHKKLEAAIKQDSSNAEFRFLRLMIQEHAPGILGYNNDIEKDSAYIKTAYKNLSPTVQQAIKDYAKNSRTLKAEEL